MSNTCMNKYKNQFAIEFAKTMQINLPQWKRLQKSYIKKLYAEWLPGYFVGFLMGLLPGKHEHNYNFKEHLLLGIVLFIVAIYLAISIENKNYQKDIKQKLFPVLLNVFSKDIIYNSGEISSYEYNASKLFKRRACYNTPDDRFCGTYNDVPFVISETEVINVEKNKKRESTERRIFKGLVMHFRMQKQINSRVLIYSKNIINKVPKGFEKVTMELEAFNQKYNVYVEKNQTNSGGQIEARYLFNTVFLERFMQLHTSFRINKMKCSVYGDSILILLETRKDLFEMNHLFKNIGDIHQYQHLFDEFASVLSFIEVLNLSSRTGL